MAVLIVCIPYREIWNERRAKDIVNCNGSFACEIKEKTKWDIISTYQDMSNIGNGVVNIWSGLSDGIPNMWNNSPWYAQGTLITAGGIVALPVAEYGITYAYMNPGSVAGGATIAGDILNPGVPSTITGTILGLYNEYKDYKNGENKTWNQLFGK
ncbi:MAG: hypothetical protein PHV08_00730 [Sulfurovaceae bacterium]|nr:hypothetical protein [Sulfurovaceae bacterium]